jgi:dipeptide/tripeptide permease
MALKDWKYSREFWTANTVELFERAAYYGVFIAVTLYLTNIVGFNDVWAAWISGGFSAGLYLLPPFMGAVADKIGFRKAIILAFSLLTVGYFSLGAFPYKAAVIPSFVILMFGGSFIKSIISGTIAKTTTEENRAKGFSIFYGIVNVGAFFGKSIAYPLRVEWGLQSINFYAAAMTLIALVVVVFFYRNIDLETAEKKFKDIAKGFVKIITNVRLILLILIISGFWMIQQQLYATMPKYVIRTVGQTASPEWISNVNPFIVMISVVYITNIMKKVKAITSMNIGMLLMPLSALLMSSSYILEKITGESVSFFGLIHAHPITVMMIAGIVVQGLAECFISPRYLEFFSLQAPKGEEGLYLGYSHLHSFFSSLIGFGISGYLLSAYCPDPKTVPPEMLATAYDKAYYIWFYFAGIGLSSAILLFIYNFFVKRINRKKFEEERGYSPENKF